MPHETRTRGTGLHWFALIVLVVLLVEATSWLAIRMVNPFLDAPILRTAEAYRDQSEKIRGLIDSDAGGGMTAFDPQLGFRNRPSFHRGKDHINSQGLRSIRDYPEDPPEGAIRVAAFGDSFVYCGEVSNPDSWPAFMEEADPGFEVLNYGVGAYGTGQSYLRFMSEGEELSPSVVLIGFSPVMMTRTVSVYRRFLAPEDSPLIKPRFTLDADGSLTMIEPPLQSISDYRWLLDEPSNIRELGAHDHWYRPSIFENPLYDVSNAVRLLVSVLVKLDSRYIDADRIVRAGRFNVSSEAFQVQVELLEKFFRQAESIADLVLIVIFPARADILLAASGKTTVYEPLLTYLDERNLKYVDLVHAFVADGATPEIESLFMPGLHYSPEANRIVARTLSREIRSSLPSPR